MKKLSLLTLMVSLWLALPLSANNTITTVEQVTGTVELTDDVDYHITSAEPFAPTGSINIKNVSVVFPPDCFISIFKIEMQNLIPLIVIPLCLGYSSRSGKPCAYTCFTDT